jgi:predicted nucleic acid-binding protein
MADSICADTSVVSRLTKKNRTSAWYDDIVEGRQLVISFQVRAELLTTGFSGRRRQRLDYLMSVVVKLPHGELTDAWYAHGSLLRKALRRRRRVGSDASDADLWIIASALENQLPLLSHDGQQVALARAMGADVLTNLPGWRDDNPPLR